MSDDAENGESGRESEGRDDGTSAGDDELTYADAGVDIGESEAATAALLDAVGNVVDTEYAGMLEVGDQYLALATDGVGTKLMVAEAVDDYTTIGIDCIAMNVNDLVAAGVEPLAFVDYLAVEEPGEDLAEQVGQGLSAGASQAEVALLGGETAVMPEVVKGFDLAGACVGMADEGDVLPGEAEPGDALVGVPSSGIHSNGLTLAREAVTREHDYADPFPLASEADSESSEHSNADRTIGEVLLEPTRIYTDCLGPMREHDARAAAHVTGGGWTNLERMGEHRYEVTDPFPIQPVFEFVQDCGDVSDGEMHRTFNMGTGFVIAVPENEAEALAADVGGRVVGRVEAGEGVGIRGLKL